MSYHFERLLVILLSLAATAAAAVPQQSAPAAKISPSCGEIKKGYGTPDRPPVIEGEHYAIPPMRLLVSDEQTGKPIAGKRIHVRWGWEWFEYPSPGKAFGAWSSASETVSCVTDERGEVQLPTRTIVPKGWYAGELLMGRKPRFATFEVSVNFERHIGSNSFKRDALDAFKERGEATFPIRVSSVYEPPE